MNDAQIVDKVLAGDTNAFELLILKYQNQVFYTVMNIVKNHESAEDISQDVFLKAFEKLNTLSDKEHFFSWLRRIAVNLSLNSYERDKRLVDVESSDDEDSTYFDRLPDTSNNPEDVLIDGEMKKYIKLFIDALPERLRTVVILREVEDMSYEDIAGALNIPTGTVRSRLFNARQIIKGRLIRQGLADKATANVG